MKVNNPRFPHTCKVYRISGETSFDEGNETVLYVGKCNKYGRTSPRTSTKDNVIKVDYAVDIPGLVKGVVSGDIVDFAILQQWGQRYILIRLRGKVWKIMLKSWKKAKKR